MIGARAKILKVPRAKGEWTRSALLRFIALLRDQSHVTSRLAPLSLFAFFFRSLDDEVNSLCSDEKEEICRALLLALATRTEWARWRRN